MKYVLLGRLDAEWAGKQKERVKKAQAKLKELGISMQAIHYTQGAFDSSMSSTRPIPSDAELLGVVWRRKASAASRAAGFDAPTFGSGVQRAGV